MMINPVYKEQVKLLLRVLPYIAEEKVFALKGGTAINLFVRDLPRLSVDIDLAYLQFDARKSALENIQSALRRIKNRLKSSITGIKVIPIPIEGYDAKLMCALENVEILVEVNTTMRGHLLEPHVLSVVDKVQSEFELFAEINIISKGELFGGKICAALDRQHPRDLFDIYYLLKNEGITDEYKQGFIAALLSHPRPINELLSPNFLDKKELFDQKFSGMTLEPFTYDDFERTRVHLIEAVKNALSEFDKQFLISFKQGVPKWELIEATRLQDMPAVKWKLLNIQKLIKSNKEKHASSLKTLEKELA